MPLDDKLAKARAARDSARTELSAARQDRADADRQLRAARSAFGERDERTLAAAQADAHAAEKADALHRRHVAALDRVAGALKDFLPEDDFEVLATTAPLVLLPVRIETRFALGGNTDELWLRVYPDDIHGDGHEPELTDDEIAAGAAYWTAQWDATATRAAAWKALVDALGATRAAWVAERMTPDNAGADPAAARPQFPTPPRRSDAWTRAVEARLLPDRWLAIGLRNGQEVLRGQGAPIVEPLALSAAPDAADSELFDLSGDGLKIDEGQRWTVDFQRALDVGMAMQLPLTAADVQQGFDRLLVVGVKGSLDGAETGDALARLFDAHRFQRGLAFVRQGTPTNNTQAGGAGWPAPDADALGSLAVERDATRSIADKDGERLARALGLPAQTFLHVDRSDADEQAGARAMCGALWPATWGYFLEELLFEDELDEDVERLRDYFVEHVRPRGPLPALRVGGTPYGVVVASNLTQWQQRGLKGLVQDALPVELRRLREFWREQVPNVARVGRSDDPDRDLLGILETDASAGEVRVRSVVGPNASLNIGSFFGLGWEPARLRQLQLAQALAARLGNPGVTSRVFSLQYGSKSQPFVRGFVVPKPSAEDDEPLSETEALGQGAQPFNYIRWLREAPSLDDVREERLPAGVEKPKTLLYLLLRHAMLREAARTADTILLDQRLVTRAMLREPEFPGVGAVAAQDNGARRRATLATPVERLQMTAPAVTGELSVARFVWADIVRPQTRRIREFREYLKTLEALPTAELERLLTETLDACSTRLDAWATAMFTDRLNGLRNTEAPRTVLGAYGWVMDLRAKPAVERVSRPVQGLDDLMLRKLKLARGALLDEQVSSGGHIHAASMAQAATAAVLRNGYLTRRQVDGSRYGVDLSSTRVRRARFILDAVRQGQPLGAVLGYQFERGLHEGHPGRELDRFIEPFRAEYPLNAGQLTPLAPGEAVEAVTARHVVHGLRLHEAFAAQPPSIPWGERGLPPAAGPDFDAVMAELRALDESIDAVSDLLLAESVHQIVRGNTAGAAASLDALSRGARPPDPEVVRSPRGGSALIHRIALLLDPAAALLPSWAAVPVTPRAEAEPRLDAWLATHIGDPARVRCAATYVDGAGATQGPVEVTLAQVGLHPIDLLQMLSPDAATAGVAAQPNTTAQASELDARITAVVLARADAAPHGKVSIDYAPTDRANTISFAELAELMRSAQSLLSTARALGPEDLVAVSQRELLPSASVDTADLATRATAAQAAAKSALDALNTTLLPYAAEPLPLTQAARAALVQALRDTAAFGLARAFVPSPHDEADADASAARLSGLVGLAKGVAAELGKRLADAVAATTPKARAEAVFGTGFKLLPRFKPVPAAMDVALSQGPSPAPTRAERREWLQGAAQVRTPLARWNAFSRARLALGGVAGGTPAATALDVTQLPHRPNARWATLPFADPLNPEQRPPSGTIGLALLHDQPLPAAGADWCGLLVDEWTELIPQREESTAVAFHYDDPGAEAPQAILIAVPPDTRERWSVETVRDVLLETLELAQIRAVDRDLLGALDQLLPATFLAGNARKDTISTHLHDALALDRAFLSATP